ncbi:MAG TPA: glycosyltransferase [Kiritimatiellia bacterium]|nr:glycosyltransferase [Kiritimatiellia bacterium]HRZ13191.1 glycosyltransferase [Kiritimatiellia bacterium]HSA19758.1 glycosyltransferase [Kiritimatiellia bacterium]
MSRVLICYLVRNSGHHSAARNVQAALHKLDPSIETMCVDLLEYTHPRWSAIVQKTYMVTIRRTPEVWEALYDRLWLEYLTRRIRRLVQRGNSRPLRDLMDRFRPDVAVCTQAHPLGVLSAYAQRHRPDLPLWGIVTDYVPHRYWVVRWPPVRYVVPGEAAGGRLALYGVHRPNLFPLGIPIHTGFVTERKTRVSREDGRRVLVMGGSRGLGARYRTIRYLDRSTEDFTIDVVTGANRRLRAKLIRNRDKFRHPIRIRGYVKDVVALMHRASLLISKPGGLTSAEAMAVGLPMVLVRPLPGQERGNTEVLVRHGAAVHLPEDRDVASVVTSLLANRELLDMMRERALDLGRPHAALDTARLILKDIAAPGGKAGA